MDAELIFAEDVEACPKCGSSEFWENRIIWVGDDHETDYDRLQQAKEKWEQAADAQLEARHRWNEERYEVKSKIATLMAKETNYDYKEQK